MLLAYREGEALSGAQLLGKDPIVRGVFAATDSPVPAPPSLPLPI